MEHVAIMRKSWGLTQKILSGEKKIESRWYSVRCKPWDGIKAGETVYFKDSGEPVAIKANVAKVMQFADVTPQRVREILRKYGADDGIPHEQAPAFFKRFEKKRYCVLIFLKNPVAVKSFEINKTGFGAMAAWITTENVLRIKK